MNTFINAFLQDPILLTAGLVFIATVFILFWILHSWRSEKTESAFTDSNENETVFPPSTKTESGLMEAQLQEINNQLAALGRRFDALEKGITTAASSGISPQNTEDIRKDFERLETKIDLITKGLSNGSPDESLKSIEAKLEGIHKLLIVLTDSGSAANQ